MSGDSAILRVSGLTKRFGDFTAVDGLSIEVARGEIFAFLGANGSGKSTTIRMVIGLLTPTAGQIVVDGVDVVASPREVRERIGYMGQKVSLYASLSLAENVEFYGGLYGLDDRALALRWGELSLRFDLREVEKEHAEDLPAGIRQRAGLALAILHRPRLLFLDEPTAGVDVESRGLFWERIREEADGGATVFVTTHFLEEVDSCDHVSLIDAGKLVADATPDELRARYSSGYRIELRGPVGESSLAAIERAGATIAHDGPSDPSVAVEGEACLRTGAEVFREGTGLVLRAPTLPPALLAALAPLGDAVRITPASMNEVFRRLFEEARQAA